MDLSNNGLGPDSAVYINRILKNVNLFHLHLGENMLGSDGIHHLNALKDNNHLMALNLSNNNINNDGVDALANILSTVGLQNLSLGYNSFGCKGLKALLNNFPTSLTYLDLRGNYITDLCLESLQSAISKGQLKTLILKDQQGGYRWSEKSQSLLKGIGKDKDCRVILS